MSAYAAAGANQYILGIQAVDPSGTAVTQVATTITPNGNKATVAFAVTTKIPANVAITDQGFSIRTTGLPKVTNSTLTRVFNLQNIDNSTTAKFMLELNVPDMIYSTDVSFVYFVTVRESADQPAVTYESDRVYFTVVGVATPTPNVTPSPVYTQTPTAPPTPSPTPMGTPMVLPSLSPLPTNLPTTPEFPAVYVMLTLLVATAAVCLVYRKAKNKA